MDTTITSALMAGLRNSLAQNDAETVALFARMLEREAQQAQQANMLAALKMHQRVLAAEAR